MKTTYLRINPADNVAVAIAPLRAGETIEADGRTITLRTDVPAGHKVTLKDFRAGENVIKYGYPIGHVMKDVPEGTWVSEKDIKTNLAGLLDLYLHAGGSTYKHRRGVSHVQGLPPPQR